MAMLITWQTLNAVRSPSLKKFGRGFLIVTPGITIRDRLRVLLPSETENYYQRLDLVPSDLMQDMGKARIVITNYHAFKLRERVALVRDYIAGFEREDENGLIETAAGRCELFRNFADDGERLAKPRTILIDSATLEAGGDIDKVFREAHTDEIAAFRREKAARGEGTEAIEDADILREVMNTVGKKGRLEAVDLRCACHECQLCDAKAIC